jgi:hypothetical protein
MSTLFPKKMLSPIESEDRFSLTAIKAYNNYEIELFEIGQ